MLVGLLSKAAEPPVLAQVGCGGGGGLGARFGLRGAPIFEDAARELGIFIKLAGGVVGR
jgi:hypothetical protein